MQAVCAHSRTKTLERKRKQWRTASRRDTRGSSCKKVDLNGRGSDERTCTRKGVLREEEPVKEGESLKKKKKTTAEEVKGWEKKERTWGVQWYSTEGQNRRKEKTGEKMWGKEKEWEQKGEEEKEPEHRPK